ncbi:glycosyltransferase family 39 protein, partial [Patescibacteria group bacterium]|nr:glycosyltransferase family 39 protein [Patescibacteria group bacterium]
MLFGFSDFGLRSFSALIGILIIPLIYCFIEKLSGDKVLALITSLVFTVNPTLIRYSQEARSYSLLVFLIIGTIYSFYNRRWFLFSLLFSLAIFTHYISIFLLPSLLIFAAIKYLKSRELDIKELISLLLPITLLVFWAPILRTHFDNANTLLGWVEKPQFKYLFSSVVSFIFESSFSGLKSLILVALILGVSLYFFTKSTKEKRSEGLFLLSFSLIPFLEVFLVSRYLNIGLYIDRVLIGFLAVFMIYLVFSLQALGKYFGISLILWYVFTALAFNSKIEVENKGYKQLTEFAQ